MNGLLQGLLRISTDWATGITPFAQTLAVECMGARNGDKPSNTQIHPFKAYGARWYLYRVRWHVGEVSCGKIGGLNFDRRDAGDVTGFWLTEIRPILICRYRTPTSIALNGFPLNSSTNSAASRLLRNLRSAIARLGDESLYKEVSQLGLKPLWEAHRMMRRWRSVSVAPAMKVRKSAEVIQDGTASTASTAPSSTGSDIPPGLPVRYI